MACTIQKISIQCAEGNYGTFGAGEDLVGSKVANQALLRVTKGIEFFTAVKEKVSKLPDLKTLKEIRVQMESVKKSTDSMAEEIGLVAKTEAESLLISGVFTRVDQAFGRAVKVYKEASSALEAAISRQSKVEILDSLARVASYFSQIHEVRSSEGADCSKTAVKIQKMLEELNQVVTVHAQTAETLAPLDREAILGKCQELKVVYERLLESVKSL